MTKETNFEHPPRGHVALLYYDVTNDRFQVVQGDDVDTAIPSAAKATLASALMHGYDGSAWRKQGMVWAYSSAYAEAPTDLNLPAGGTIKYGAVVPAGEVWVVSTIVGTVTSGTATALYLGFSVAGKVVWVKIISPPVSGSYYLQTGQFVLGSADKAVWYIGGATAGDDWYGYILGYKMKIDM